MKTPSFQFRGIFVPAKVLTGLVNKELTRTQLLLLMIVESFVESGKGCWATNDYLATVMNSNPNFISDSIQSLIEKGFLKKEIRNGTRWLETCWSGEMNDVKPVNEDSGSEKSVRGTEKSVRSIQKNLYHNNMIELNRRVNKSTLKREPLFCNLPKKKKKSFPSPTTMITATTLKNTVEKKYGVRVPWKLKDQAIWGYTLESFSSEIEGSWKRVDELINMFKKDIPEYPVIKHAKDLVRHHLWIEQVWMKDKKKNEVLN